MPIRAVTVYCSSSRQVPSVYTDAAHALGLAIAGAGWNLVYGGNDTGCMGVLARAARAGGTRVIGVSPRIFVDKGIVDKACDELIITDDMRQRKRIMEDSGDAFIALPGGIGTFEELFEILVGRQLKYHNKPIVVLNIENYFDPFVELLTHGQQLGFIRARTMTDLYIAPDIPAAIEHIRQHDDPGESVDADSDDANDPGLEG